GHRRWAEARHLSHLVAGNRLPAADHVEDAHAVGETSLKTGDPGFLPSACGLVSNASITLMRWPRSRSFESGYHARAPLTLIGKPPSRSAHRAHRRLSLRFLELEPRVETLGMSRGAPKVHAHGLLCP